MVQKKELPSREEIRESLRGRHGRRTQELLENARVAVAGLGGLGSHVAVMLARAGVGTLHLVDFDRVDLSNLNRQEYWVSQIGRYKTEAMREILLEINPYLQVETDTVRLDESNVLEIFQKDSLVCEAFDRAESKAMLINTLLSARKDVVLVAASGMAGSHSGNAIRTVKKMRRLYLCGDETNGIEQGESLMAPRVTLCAAHRANMLVRLLLGKTEV